MCHFYCSILYAQINTSLVSEFFFYAEYHLETLLFTLFTCLLMAWAVRSTGMTAADYQ